MKLQDLINRLQEARGSDNTTVEFKITNRHSPEPEYLEYEGNTVSNHESYPNDPQEDVVIIMLKAGV